MWRTVSPMGSAICVADRDGWPRSGVNVQSLLSTRAWMSQPWIGGSYYPALDKFVLDFA